MSASGPPPADDEVHGEEEEAFITEADGEVVADLEGSDIEDEPEEDDDEEEEGGEGGEGDGEDKFMAEDVVDNAAQTYMAHSDAVVSACWSPTTPGLAATGGCDDKAFLFMVGQEGAKPLAGHTDTVASIGFSAGGTLLATGGMDGKTNVWDTTSASLVGTLEGPGGAIEWLQWHPKGDVVLAGAEDFTCWMWHATKGSCMQVFTGHAGTVTAGGFTPDGKLVVTASDDGALRIWDPRSGACGFTVSGHGFHKDGLTCIDFHADSQVVVTGGMDGAGCLTNLQTGKPIGQLRGNEIYSQQGHSGSVEAVGFCPGLPIVATASLDTHVFLWDTQNMQQRGKLTHADGVTCMKWLPNSPVAVTGSLDGIVRVWDVRSGKCERSFTGHRSGVQCISVSPDGTAVLSGGDDNCAKVFML